MGGKILRDKEIFPRGTSREAILQVLWVFGVAGNTFTGNCTWYMTWVGNNLYCQTAYSLPPYYPSILPSFDYTFTLNDNIMNLPRCISTCVLINTLVNDII